MKRPSKQAERWTVGILCAVCLGLMVFLSRQVLSDNAGQASAAQSVPVRNSHAIVRPRAVAMPAAIRDDLERYNPELNLELLKQIETHPLPESSRNPFEYPPPPKPKPSPIGPTIPPPPPPPPPLPLKAIGYSIKAGNVAEAVVTDDEEIYVVHVGETFAKRFRVLSLTPDKIEIQDATTQQIVQLPIAQ